MALTPAQFEAKMHELADTIRDPEEPMQKIVLVVEGRAKRNSPVGLTGNLQRSNKGIVESPTVGKLTNSADYAKFVDEGTSHMEAQPFAEDAIEESVDDAVQILESYGNTVLGRVGG